jgi:hypothetical protein
MTTLDHIVIIAKSLSEGLDYCENQLGVRPPKGGEHERMGTYNHLLNLRSGVYLEVIAVNPFARTPERARWFGFDSPAQHARLVSGPYLATFVVRTKNIDAVARKLPTLGLVQGMERGTLHWQITIRDDGALVENGTLPSVIEWPDGIEPTMVMPDLGYRFLRLDIYHPQPHRLENMWEQIELCDGRLSVHPCDSAQAPYLVAHIETPDGIKTISGRA